jgi:hypothetical protein
MGKPSAPRSNPCGRGFTSAGIYFPEKNPLAADKKPGLRWFPKPGAGFLLLMKSVGAVLPHPTSFGVARDRQSSFLFFSKKLVIAGHNAGAGWDWETRSV